MLLSRRALLAAAPALGRAAGPGVKREVFLASPKKGVAVMAYAFYTRRGGGQMRSVEQRFSRSDTVDVAYIRHSRDHGRTWSAPEEMITGERRPEGMLRRHPRAGFVDRATGRYVEFWVEGVLPSDDPLEGMRQWNLFYRVDGGPALQIIHAGDEYGPRHPLPGIWTGKNCVMLGDVPCVPINARDGSILLPAITTPLGPDGKLYNPTGGYTYTDAAILIGRWQGRELRWEMSDVVKGDPARVTRGMDEPTIEFLEDGRVLMILRGSNDKNPQLASRRWMAYSSDGGRRWTKPEPWTYD
ncbi:MAG: sialidase family protein, partial [Bryobacteraceae bacterium]